MIKSISTISFNSHQMVQPKTFSPFTKTMTLQTLPPQPTSPVAKKYNNKISTKKIIMTSVAILVGAAGMVYGKSLKATPDELYRRNLASGLSELLGVKIKSNKLKSVIGKEELLKILPTLKAENYKATPENIKNCIFMADLHSHSIFSDGVGKVEDILSKVAEYADKLHEKNGRKFLFALTDHNEVRGVERALQIIAENPRKFKNVQFIPGMEISYALKVTNSNNPFEVAEVLAYGINPFSKNITDFVKNIHQKRQKMMNDFLTDLKALYPDTTFSLEEMSKYYPTDKTCLMNLQWQVHHYAQTKMGISQLAKTRNMVPENLYKEIMDKCTSRTKTLHVLKEQNLVPDNIFESYEITRLAKEKYSTNISNDIINAPTENTFDEMISTFSKEQSAFLAFAHPAYINKNMNNLDETLSLLRELTEKSKGLIKGTESYHQAYKFHAVSQQDIDKIKEFTDRLGLLNLGGHDSHAANWIIQ